MHYVAGSVYIPRMLKLSGTWTCITKQRSVVDTCNIPRSVQQTPYKASCFWICMGGCIIIRKPGRNMVHVCQRNSSCSIYCSRVTLANHHFVITCTRCWLICIYAVQDNAINRFFSIAILLISQRWVIDSVMCWSLSRALQYESESFPKACVDRFLIVPQDEMVLDSSN